MPSALARTEAFSFLSIPSALFHILFPFDGEGGIHDRHLHLSLVASSNPLSKGRGTCRLLRGTQVIIVCRPRRPLRFTLITRILPAMRAPPKERNVTWATPLPYRKERSDAGMALPND